MCHKNFYPILLLVIKLALISCSQNNQLSDHLIINIDLDQTEELNLNDLFNNINLVPLETTSKAIIGECTKLHVFNNRFYIYDRIQQSVFAFDEKGKLLFSTKNMLGRGPKEYSSLDDFNINFYTGHIELLDVVQQKIIKLDYHGNYAEEISLPRELLPINSFIPINEDIYLFYSDYYTREERLFFYSINNNKIISKTLKTPLFTTHLTSAIKNSFYEHNNGVFFRFKFPSNCVYLINKEKLMAEKIVEFNLGKNNFIVKDLPVNESKEYYRSLSRNSKYAFIINSQESEKYYWAHILFNKKTYIARYNKEKSETSVFYKEFNKSGQLPPHDFLIDNNLFFVCETPEFLQYIVSETLLDTKSKIALERIRPDDNAIIVKYSLK